MEPRIFMFLRLFLNILKSTGFMGKMNFQYLLDFKGKGIQEINNTDISWSYDSIVSYNTAYSFSLSFISSISLHLLDFHRIWFSSSHEQFMISYT